MNFDQYTTVDIPTMLFTFYKLNDDKSVSAIDGLSNFNIENRIIDRTKVGEKIVSTVFLIIDHNYGNSEESKPILFETMVFPKEGDFTDEQCERYCTYDKAVAGHNRIVKQLNQALPIQRRDLRTIKKSIQLR
jgi:hypothetical protein